MNNCPPCPECGSQNTELKSACSTNPLDMIKKYLPEPFANQHTASGINYLICKDCGKTSLLAIR